MRRTAEPRTPSPPPDGPASLGYAEDFALWSQAQAAAIRAGHWRAVDLENVAEEIESLGRSDRQEIKSRLTVLLIHLLKLLVQPERATRSWLASCREQRRGIAAVLEDSPSLRRLPAERLQQCFVDAVKAAIDETGLPPDAFPAECPFPIDAVLDADWYPIDIAGLPPAP